MNNSLTNIVAIRPLLILSLLCGAQTLHAANPFKKISPDQWEEAMVISGFDSELLYAIALVESGTSFDGMRSYGPWPWVMNINNKPYFYASKTAAREALQAELDKQNDRVAVGMFQIYLKYNAKYAKDPLDLIDPVVNLYAGAMVLSSCGETYDTTEEILSCYHSGNVDKAGINYAKRVIEYAETWGKPFRMRSNLAEVKYTRRSIGDSIFGKPITPVQTLPPLQPTAITSIAPANKHDKRSISFMSSIATDLPSLAPTTTMDHMKRLGLNKAGSPRRVILVDQ